MGDATMHTAFLISTKHNCIYLPNHREEAAQRDGST